VISDSAYSRNLELLPVVVLMLGTTPQPPCTIEAQGKRCTQNPNLKSVPPI
jgi:hypothetical protein